jgi:hypothetical protein
MTNKAYFLQVTSHGVHFIKHDIPGCIFKMCRNFTYEVVEQRRKLKAIKKIVAQKINVILFFDIEFFKYFFRVIHEASSSWLKCLHNFQNHPAYYYILLVFTMNSQIGYKF